MKNNKDHLPIYGPGPVFGGVVIALTVAAMFCRNLPVFQCGNIASLRIPLIVIGILLILFAVFLWVYAVIIPMSLKPQLENKIPDNLKSRIIYVENDCKDIWDWSEKVYRIIEQRK